MNNDAVDKFIFLMKLNGKHIRIIANYLVSIWEFRKSILYTNNTVNDIFIYFFLILMYTLCVNCMN